MLAIEPAIRLAEVIGNGVDCRRFFREGRVQAREKLGLDPQAKIILSVAALKPLKGPDLLVRAGSLLKAAVPGCEVLFVGDGPELRRLRRLAAQLDCADICEFLGPVANEELNTYYSAANVSCLPSRREGWPNVVLESLACGTPVVATRVGAIPDILSRPELGIVVDTTAQAIYKGLGQALARDWDADIIAAHARPYTWEAVAARVEDFLTRMLARGPVGHVSPSAVEVSRYNSSFPGKPFSH